MKKIKKITRGKKVKMLKRKMKILKIFKKERGKCYAEEKKNI